MTRYLKRPEHPLAPASGMMPRGRVVLYDTIGSTNPSCHWCSAPLRWAAARSDKDRVVVCHLDGDNNNDSPSNLAPSCHPCNTAHGHSARLSEGGFIRIKGGTRRAAVERICEECGDPFLCERARITGPNKGRFCSKDCANAGQRQDEVSSRYRYMTIAGHPLSPPSGKIPAHRVILYDSIGPGPHLCNWCGTEVNWSTKRTAKGCLVVDHRDGNGQNNDLSNLVPSCHSCNLSRRTP